VLFRLRKLLLILERSNGKFQLCLDVLILLIAAAIYQTEIIRSADACALKSSNIFRAAATNSFPSHPNFSAEQVGRRAWTRNATAVTLETCSSSTNQLIRGHEPINSSDEFNELITN
jgi:hypothetical protein